MALLPFQSNIAPSTWNDVWVFLRPHFRVVVSVLKVVNGWQLCLCPSWAPGTSQPDTNILRACHSRQGLDFLAMGGALSAQVPVLQSEAGMFGDWLFDLKP